MAEVERRLSAASEREAEVEVNLKRAERLRRAILRGYGGRPEDSCTSNERQSTGGSIE